MTRSKEFVRDLQRRLTESSAHRRYDWKDGREWKPEKGERQAVDLVGKPMKGGPVLLIEVELRRGDPSSNVLKIWMWKLHKKLNKEFILFQAFSRYYNRKNHTLIMRAAFLGKRMEKIKRGQEQSMSRSSSIIVLEKVQKREVELAVIAHGILLEESSGR